MQGKVPVGVATVAGYGVTVTGFAAAVVAFIMGDRDEQTDGVIVAGAVAGLAFAITQIGRYVQAKAAIKYQPIPWPDADVEKAEGPVNEIDLDGDGVFDPLPGELEGVAAPADPVADVGDGEQVKTDG